MDLIASEYGWTDERILGCTLRRLRQIAAAIQRRQWTTDLSHRRLETAKLRAVCTYIAATMQLAEGAENTMLAAAFDLHLGTGTENTHTRPDTPPAAGGAPAMPAARIPLTDLPDAPTAVRPGQPAPTPAGMRELPLERLGSFLTGDR